MSILFSVSVASSIVCNFGREAPTGELTEDGAFGGSGVGQGAHQPHSERPDQPFGPNPHAVRGLTGGGGAG